MVERRSKTDRVLGGLGRRERARGSSGCEAGVSDRPPLLVVRDDKGFDETVARLQRDLKIRLRGAGIRDGRVREAYERLRAELQRVFNSGGDLSVARLEQVDSDLVLVIGFADPDI